MLPMIISEADSLNIARAKEYSESDFQMRGTDKEAVCFSEIKIMYVQVLNMMC